MQSMNSVIQGRILPIYWQTLLHVQVAVQMMKFNKISGQPECLIEVSL